MKPRADHGGRALEGSFSGLKVVGALLVMGTLYCCLAASPRQKKSPPPPDYALVTGSVFNPQGGLVSNATVEVHEVNGHHRHWEAMTDEMGEFFVQVPPGKADYQVRASASGYVPDQQVVHVTADERETIFLHLARKR